MEVNTLTKTREQRLADLFTQGKILGFFNDDLRYIIRYVKSLRQEAWQLLLSQAPTNNDLRYIIRYVKSLRQKAGQQLLRQAPTNDDLCYIIEYVKSLRQEAWQLLLSQEPTNDDLCYIIENVKPLRQEAKSWLYPIIVPQTLEQIMSEIKQLA